MGQGPLTMVSARLDPASAMCLTGDQRVLPVGPSSQRRSGLFADSLGLL